MPGEEYKDLSILNLNLSSCKTDDLMRTLRERKIYF